MKKKDLLHILPLAVEPASPRIERKKKKLLIISK
jgi:hypothetical protein